MNKVVPTFSPQAQSGQSKTAGPPTIEIQNAVVVAMDSVANSVQLCFVAGQLLHEKKKAVGDGQFEAWRNKHLPGLKDRTARRWASAAENVSRRLPPPDGIPPVSVILSSPKDELSPEALKYKNAWLQFVGNSTVAGAAAGLFSGGEADALNGILTGGNPDGALGRRAYEVYAGRNLARFTSFLKRRKYIELTQAQTDFIKRVMESEMERWPRWCLEAARKKASKELKMGEQERLARPR
ncbi:MAG: hypothetical protein ACREE6_09205 [Limisphaerales bacterium]